MNAHTTLQLVLDMDQVVLTTLTMCEHLQVIPREFWNLNKGVPVPDLDARISNTRVPRMFTGISEKARDAKFKDSKL